MANFLAPVLEVIETYNEMLILLLAITTVTAIVAVVKMNARLSKMIETYRKMMGSANAETLEAAVTENIRCVDEVRRTLSELKTEQLLMKQYLEHCIQKVGLIRFNAFDDMGGDMSFSIALLDRLDNGFILSSISGREETRVYAKPVTSGRSAYHLSEEEKQVLSKAKQEIAR